MLWARGVHIKNWSWETASGGTPQWFIDQVKGFDLWSESHGESQRSFKRDCPGCCLDKSSRVVGGWACWMEGLSWLVRWETLVVQTGGSHGYGERWTDLSNIGGFKLVPFKRTDQSRSGPLLAKCVADPQAWPWPLWNFAAVGRLLRIMFSIVRKWLRNRQPPTGFSQTQKSFFN